MNRFCFRLALCCAGVRVSGQYCSQNACVWHHSAGSCWMWSKAVGMRAQEGSEEPNLIVLGEAWRTSSSPFLLLSPDSLQLSRSWCDPLLCGDYSCAVQPLSKLELYLFFSADLCCLILLKIEMHWKWLSSYKCGNIRVDVWGYKSIKLPFEHWLSR